MHLKGEVDINRPYPAPRKVFDIKAWLRQAQKVIREIPATAPPSLWVVAKTVATPNYVQFELVNGDDFCHVVIDRKASSLST